MKSLLFARLTHPVRDKIFLNIIIAINLEKYSLGITILRNKEDIPDILKTL